MNGLLTRQQWQEECLKQLLAGKDAFNKWQQELAKIEFINPRANTANFDFDIRWVDNTLTCCEFSTIC
ncbi:MAG: hypothetical protein WA435_02795 [Gallionellaceae bacterium]